MHRLLPPVLLLAVVLTMILLHKQVELPVVVPEAVRHISWGLIACGLGIAVVARAQIARARTTINTFARPAQLVTSGLFRFSRNPTYVGLSMMVIGFGLACGAVSSLLLAVLFVAITDGWYIAFEERMLKQTFGGAFDEYARSTRRWL